MLSQPIPPKKSNTGLIIGVVVAVVIVVMVLVAFVLMTAWNGGKYAAFEGAYAEWDYTAVAFFMPLSGTMRIEVIEVTSSDWTVLMSVTGDIPMDSETETYPSDEDLSGYWTLGTYQENEYVSTIYGTKELKHYTELDDGMTWDYYVGEKSNWPYKIVAEDSSMSVTFEISATNIEWVMNE